MAEHAYDGQLPFAGTAAPSYDSWKLVLLEDAVAHGAQCLDGSAAGYYVERGSARGVFLHLQGGGWCTSLEDCASRVKTALGSSATYGNGRDSILNSYDGGAHGLFSNATNVNPQFYNLTKVYVRYCDGGSYSGDTMATSPDGSPLHFRGRRILDAVLDALVNKERLTTVICSLPMGALPAALRSGCTSTTCATT